MKTSVILTSLLASSTLSQAALHINTGVTGTADSQGPNGANANYLAYTTSHETASSGALQTFNGTSFVGLSGTYDVGVSFSWPDANNLNVTGSFDEHDTKQAFDRDNIDSYDEFWQTWIGVDTRASHGGIGGGDELILSLSGLAANTNFVFTSYHFDTQNLEGSFTVDQTPSASETATSPFAFDVTDGSGTQTPWETNAYSFDVTTDSSGNLDITYTHAGGTWIGINGFDLVSTAVPEPSSTALLGLGGIALLLRRRR